jgi:hypothetical protein
MKFKIKCLTRVLWLIALTIVLQGCVTTVASKLVPGEREFHNNPVLSDDILAIGRPDEAILKQMELSNTIAFIGEKNTYMLYLGGEELEQISNLKLDGKRMTIASAQSLFLKDKQIWGEIELHYYVGNKEVSAVEMAELNMGGFAPDQRPGKKGYFRTTVRIEGVVYPAIKIPDEQISKLNIRRNFNLYNPREASPPILGKILKVPIVATGIVADMMLVPVYMGMGVAVMLGASASRSAR